MKDFGFGGINVNSRKQVLNLKRYDNPVLVDNGKVRANYEYPIVVLVEERYGEKELKYIDNFLKSAGAYKYIILHAINCDYDPKEAREGIIKFYKANKSDFYKYIPKNSPVLTSGPALYSLLQEDDLYPNHCNQIIFGKSNFWFSIDLTQEKCHRVYPMESLKNDIFGYELYDKWCPRAVDSYKTKLAQIQINLAIKYNSTTPPEYPELNKIFIESEEDFIERFYEPNKDRKNEYLAWDLETSGLNFYKDKIGCITLSFDGHTGYYIPWKYVDKKKLGEILKNNKQVGANLKFDVEFLWKNGVPEAYIDEDVIQLGHTLDETRSNSLKSLAFFYSIYGGYERPLDLYKEKMGGDKVNYLEIPENTLREYAVMDAIVTWQVYDNLISHCRELDRKYPNEFSENGMEHYYRTFKIPAENMYSRIEYTGVYMDKDELDKVRNDIKKDIQKLKDQLCEDFNVDKDFQWESGQKLGKLLEEKGWEDWGRTKSGELATGDFQISRWKKTHPEAKTLEQLKSFNTLLNTFIGDEIKNSAMAEWMGTYDGNEDLDKGWTQYLQFHKEDESWRMHPHFLSMMADSGRSRCTAPNMQQVPTRGAYAKEIKNCIKTPNDEEFYLATADYSSLQMRLAAVDIRDPNDPLVKLLQGGSGVDLHSNTSYNTFYADKEVDIDIITVEQDGKTYEFLGGQVVMTDHGEKFAIDLKDDDTILEQ